MGHRNETMKSQINTKDNKTVSQVINTGASSHSTAAGSPTTRHREGPPTAQFGADDEAIGSLAIRIGACHHARAHWYAKEASSLRDDEVSN